MKSDNLKFVAVSAVCISLCSLPVANAAITHVVNADKVDGLHAIKSTSNSAQRRGKLVAFSKKNGLLPDNIISSAPNANKLDGHPASYYLSTTGTAANANRLAGFGPSSFLGVGAKAADSDLLDGHDSTYFQPAVVLPRGGYSTIRAGRQTPLLRRSSTGPSFTFACASGGASRITASWASTRATTTSPIFWQGGSSSAARTMRRTASTATSQRFVLPAVTDGSGRSTFAWHDTRGVHQLSVSYTYGAGRCSVLAQAQLTH